MLSSLPITEIHKYHIIGNSVGGMGIVYHLEKDKNNPSSFTEEALQKSSYLMNKAKFIYRERLAAKVIKNEEFRDQFERELKIWLKFEEDGCVPLLKILSHNENIFAIMPFYEMTLSDLIYKPNQVDKIELIKSLIPCISSLANINKKHGILHLDLKPENILVQFDLNKTILRVSDWGISNIQNQFLKVSFIDDFENIETKIGGTIPYLSPERIELLRPDLKSDIFSLGIILFEILFKRLPYNENLKLLDQIYNHSYYNFVLKSIDNLDNNILKKLLTTMLHPEKNKRISSYEKIIKLIRKL